MGKPVKTHKLGNISCAIFENQFGESVSLSHAFQKSYKTKEGEWKYSGNFTEADLRTLYCLIGGIVTSSMKTEGATTNSEPPKEFDPFS